MAGRIRARSLGFALIILAGCSSSPTVVPGGVTTPPAAVPSVAPASSSPSSNPGATGKGVTVVVIDRGIDWRNADFRNADGTTRIRAMLDMSGQKDWCSAGRPKPVEYSRERIDAALRGDGVVPADAVGHGTATAGLAAGSGRSLPDRTYAGVAPDADLIVVKAVSEGAPAHGDVPAEAAFNACLDDALDWVDGWIRKLGQPAVAILNSGTQWGPIDGTSALSRKIASIFPPDSPGRIFVASAGDEGGIRNHAGGDFSSTSPLTIPFHLTANRSYPTAWYTGAVPARITITLDDGTKVGPVDPGASRSGGGSTITQYAPGAEFYPWTSTSGDRAVWMNLEGKAGRSGSISFAALGSGRGHVDVYGDVLGPNPLTSSIEFDSANVSGSVNDVSSTRGVLVAGVSVALESFVDVGGTRRDFSAEGLTGGLWNQSSGGRTRDGRAVVDVVAAGQNVPATLAAGSWWSTLRGVQPETGGGLYIRFGGTSAAGPIVVGTVALMLQVAPALTTEGVRAILHQTAAHDGFTGTTPNDMWGYGKLDIAAAVAKARAK